MLVLISSMASSAGLASRCSTMPGDPAVAPAQDAPVAARVLDTRRQHGGGVAGALVGVHEGGDAGRLQQGVVAGEDHDGGGVVDVVVGEGGQADDDGVAGATLDRLLDEQDVEGVGALVLHLLGDALGAVAGHHDGAHDLQVGEGLEDVHDHRPPAQQVQRLGALGPHPRAFAGGEHDGGDGAGVHGQGVAKRASAVAAVRWGGPWRVVQLAEHRTLDPDVAGSSPAPPAGVLSQACSAR